MIKGSKSENGHTSQPHNVTTFLLVMCAILLLLIITFGTWAKNNLFNTQKFTEHVVAAVQQEPVRNAIATGVTDRLFADFPIANRLLSKPTESFISSQLATERAGNVLDNLASNLQNRAIRGNSKPVVIDISGFTDTIVAMRETIAPESEPRFVLPQGDDARIVILRGDEIPNLQNAGMVILAVTPIATAALIVLAVVGWYKVSRKPRYFKITGIVLITTGCIVLIFTNTTTAQLSLLANTANQAVILEAVYTEFISNLQKFQAILIGTGLGIVVMAALYDRRSQLGAFANKLHLNTQK